MLVLWPQAGGIFVDTQLAGNSRGTAVMLTCNKSPCPQIAAIVRQDLSVLLRSALVHLPLAALLTAVAVELVQLSLAATDMMCTYVSRSTGGDAQAVVSSVAGALDRTALAVGQPAVASFALFISGVVIAVGALLLWVELVLRTAAIYVAVLFLPLALATLVWPSVSHWCRRLAETLAALVLSKRATTARPTSPGS